MADSGVKVSITINVNGESTKLDVPISNVDKVKNASVTTSYSKDAEALELRLMTTDDNDESKQMELKMDILSYVQKLLKAGNKAELLAFLNKNKHRFSSDTKEFIKDGIRGASNVKT